MKERDVARHVPRMDRRIREEVHDPYKMQAKPLEPLICPKCGAVFQAGRWQWKVPLPSHAHAEICQACRRAQDKYPAGSLTLTGSFVNENRDDVLRVIRHQERFENAERPLHRIMGIEEKPGRVVLSTTDIRLPRRMGEALQDAFRGSIDLHYEKGAYFLRVKCKRKD